MCVKPLFLYQELWCYSFELIPRLSDGYITGSYHAERREWFSCGLSVAQTDGFPVCSLDRPPAEAGRKCSSTLPSLGQEFDFCQSTARVAHISEGRKCRDPDSEPQPPTYLISSQVCYHICPSAHSKHSLSCCTLFISTLLSKWFSSFLTLVLLPSGALAILLPGEVLICCSACTQNNQNEIWQLPLQLIQIFPKIRRSTFDCSHTDTSVWPMLKGRRGNVSIQSRRIVQSFQRNKMAAELTTSGERHYSVLRHLIISSLTDSNFNFMFKILKY